VSVEPAPQTESGVDREMEADKAEVPAAATDNLPTEPAEPVKQKTNKGKMRFYFLISF